MRPAPAPSHFADVVAILKASIGASEVLAKRDESSAVEALRVALQSALQSLKK